MKCWKCSNPGGNCSTCRNNPNRVPAQPDPAAGGASAADSNEGFLKVFAIIAAALYGLGAVRGLGNFLYALSGGGFPSPGALNALLALAGLLLDGAMCAALGLIALKRTEENSDGLLALLLSAGAWRLGVHLLNLGARWFFGRGHHHHLDFSAVRSGLSGPAGVIAAVAGVYLILRLLMGERPLAGKRPGQLFQELRGALSCLARPSR